MRVARVFPSATSTRIVTTQRKRPAQADDVVRCAGPIALRQHANPFTYRCDLSTSSVTRRGLPLSSGKSVKALRIR